ncbi:hypothetical protein [Nocardia gipuzkoensis]|uniref:hypothetical protein n=1 Tax=Nocardia gipuzkoensis TaxID=2749991 RepID=UPI00237D4028|nr:hypothetical protein [Nocardia gipuzkoensis]MDE1673784.1 hypothetical protein [Nocardia gipuzkoensis]
MPKKGRRRVTVLAMARQQRCLAAFVAGKSYAAIALEEGYASESGARMAVKAVLERTAVEGAEQLRPELLLKFGEMYRRGFAMMEQGEKKDDLDKWKAGAVVADRAAARIMRLMGLDQANTVVQFGGDPGALVDLKNAFAAALDGEVPIDAEVVDQ